MACKPHPSLPLRKAKECSLINGVFLQSLVLVWLLSTSIVHAVPTTTIHSDKRQCYPDAASTYTALMAKAKADSVININTAQAADFVQLDGIGHSGAAAIVAYREAHGRFSSVDELMQVKGIGQRTVDKNRGRLKVW